MGQETIILHDVAGHFSKASEVSLLSVDEDGTADIGRSETHEFVVKQFCISNIAGDVPAFEELVSKMVNIFWNCLVLVT